MKIYKSVIDVIGKTPLIELSKLEAEYNIKSTVAVKLERQNPGGSIKDRAALSMLDDAEQKGLLKKGATIIEPTSGNTGVGLAMICAVRGYKLILTMPETMSIERRLLLASYGAEIVLTDGKSGMKGAIAKAKEIADNTPNSIIIGQFVNSANCEAHYKTTAPEIWLDTDGKVDVLVCGVGTGGTLTGNARYLKEKNPNIRVVAVEPATSAVLSGEKAGPHGLMGIGAGFVPEILDTSLIDEIVKVSNEDAYETGRFLCEKEGMLVGITSGAAVFAAKEIAKKEEYQGKLIVAICPDTGERYLSTPMFSK